MQAGRQQNRLPSINGQPDLALRNLENIRRISNTIKLFFAKLFSPPPHRDYGPSAVHDDGRHDADVVVADVVEGRPDAVRTGAENEVLAVPVIAQSVQG